MDTGGCLVEHQNFRVCGQQRFFRQVADGLGKARLAGFRDIRRYGQQGLPPEIEGRSEQQFGNPRGLQLIEAGPLAQVVKPFGHGEGRAGQNHCLHALQ